MKSALTLILSAAVSASIVAQQKPPAFAPIPAPENVAKPPADAARTASGLASIVLQAGKGTAKPAATDMVTVNYTGGRRTARCSTAHSRAASRAPFPSIG